MCGIVAAISPAANIVPVLLESRDQPPILDSNLTQKNHLNFNINMQLNNIKI